MAKRKVSQLESGITVGRTPAESARRIKELEKIAPVDVLVSEIVIKPPFSDVFPAKDATYTAIAQSIATEGFDTRFPVFLWSRENQYILVDGHRRVAAAKAAGIPMVPAIVIEDLETVSQVKSYMWRIQFFRRNIVERDLLHFVRSAREDTDTLNEFVSRFPDMQEGTVRTKEKLARVLSVSPSTIQRVLTVIDNASKEQIAAIEDGHTTIAAVARDIADARKGDHEQVAPIDPEAPEPSDGPPIVDDLPQDPDGDEGGEADSPDVALVDDAPVSNPDAGDGWGGEAALHTLCAQIRATPGVAAAQVVNNVVSALVEGGVLRHEDAARFL